MKKDVVLSLVKIKLKQEPIAKFCPERTLIRLQLADKHFLDTKES